MSGNSKVTKQAIVSARFKNRPYFGNRGEIEVNKARVFLPNEFYVLENLYNILTKKKDKSREAVLKTFEDIVESRPHDFFKSIEIDHNGGDSSY